MRWVIIFPAFPLLSEDIPSIFLSLYSGLLHMSANMKRSLRVLAAGDSAEKEIIARSAPSFRAGAVGSFPLSWPVALG